MLKHLDHPYILQVYEFWQDNKSYNFITEYCPGGELFSKMIEIRGKILSEKVSSNYIRNIL